MMIVRRNSLLHSISSSLWHTFCFLDPSTSFHHELTTYQPGIIKNQIENVRQMTAICTIIVIFVASCTGLNTDVSIQPHVNCARSWPELELFLPVSIRPETESTRNGEFLRIFIRSFLLFWPLTISNTTISLYFDEEVQHTADFLRAKESLTSAIKQSGHKETSFRIVFNKPTVYYNDRGYDRQQLIMVVPDF